MPVTSVKKSKPISSKRQSLTIKAEKKSSVQTKFASNKLIQNLGSGRAQYKNLDKLRNALGRD